jgi:hypothetical protein
MKRKVFASNLYGIMNANTIELNINESSEHSKHMTSCEQMAQV